MANALIGHGGSYLDTYYLKSLDERRKDYAKIIPELLVFTAKEEIDPVAMALAAKHGTPYAVELEKLNKLRLAHPEIDMLTMEMAEALGPTGEEIKRRMKKKNTSPTQSQEVLTTANLQSASQTTMTA
jgi:hypothetical protein